MNKNTLSSSILILLLALIALYLVAAPSHPAWLVDLLSWQEEGAQSLKFRQGLDLQGGLQVLLVADLPADEEVPPGALATARQIVERRVNAMGLTEPVVQEQGERRIIVELPGIDNPEQAIDTIRDTALLEFAQPPPGLTQEDLTTLTGQAVSTTFGLDETETGSSTSFETILTGAALRDAAPTINQQTGQWVVQFELQSEGAQIFADYTASHIGEPLCIILDKQLITCPGIDSPITSGAAVIRGNFTYDSAQQLAIQLRYGALPIPLEIESYRAIGPSLGQTSVEKSVRAGVVGLSVVLLFMLIYYRLNGLAADLALALYVLLNLLLYKLIPVTLTLPGIAGFLLSAGMAVDANILVFERMKEELRRGRSLNSAIEAGFARAWTSVRDSNLATLLTCAILFFFGNAFAASLVKGFAITLAIGTTVNLFTAIFVTRTLVRAIFALFGEQAVKRPWLLGI
ncbi:MAG: protein translocase subunit SecD [Anaerolineae bacterium]